MNYAIFKYILKGSTSYEAGNEEYQGSWVNDLMEGYGVYK